MDVEPTTTGNEPASNGPNNRKGDPNIPPHSDEERGFSEEEVAIALKVLSTFSKKHESGNKQHIMHATYRDLRKAALQFNEEMERHMYHGMTAKEYERRKVRNKWKKSERTRLKELDMKRINQVKLRAERLESLRALCEPGHSTPLTITSSGEVVDPLESTRLTITDTAHGASSSSSSSALVAAKDPQPMKVDSRKDLISPSVKKTESLADAIESKLPHKVDLKIVKEEKSRFEQDPGKPGKRKRMKANKVSIKDYDSDESEEEALNYARSCYTCKARFQTLHQFYDQLCPPCAALNWEKRNQVADLTGKVMIVTGARVKIGFEASLKLLRCGATVIATTRFPHDAAKRFAAAEGFDAFKANLHLFGLDLRDLRAVVRFTDIIHQKYDRLDAIVNNAAQTIRRPPAYYSHLMKDELVPTEALPEQLQPLIMSDPHVDPSDPTPQYIKLSRGFVPSIAPSEDQRRSTMTIEAVDEDDAAMSLQPEGPSSHNDAIISHVLDTMTHDPNYANGNRSALMSQMAVIPGDHVHDKELFPEGKVDVTGQQLDLRRTNSWLLTLDQVEPSELVEVFAVNALAPFILNSRLKPLMTRTGSATNKWIINVSAMEGKFYRYKNCNHPHTNMAKAALNMLTRTSAQQYARENIYMNSVDTGWINDENPFEKTQEIAATNNFQTPIDEVDAMARILDPILVGARTGVNTFGQFYKDYKPTEW